MKKLFLIGTLLLSLASYSQDSYEILYNKVLRDSWQVEQTLFELSDGLKEMKITSIDSGIKRYFTLVTEDKTDGGFVYYYAFYVDDYTNEEVLYQLFKDDKFGSRLIYQDGRIVQYSGKVSEE
ncbi:hypothetical protein [Flavobacterium sp.]|uniref:hypothetical protein n=1 Tax=Flavobacterium sp. TaxID=239 RepID=UPI003D2E395C